MAHILGTHVILYVYIHMHVYLYHIHIYIHICTHLLATYILVAYYWIFALDHHTVSVFVS